MMKFGLPTRALRRSLGWAAGFVAFWFLFLSVIATQHIIGGAFEWTDAYQLTLSRWLPWILLSPFLLWFTFRFPIEREGWVCRVLLHTLVCALTLVCIVLEDRFAPPLLPPWSRRGPLVEAPFPPSRQAPMPDSFRSNARPLGFGPPSSRFWFRVRFNLPIYFTFASLGHAFVYFRRAQQRKRHELELEASLAQARLQALRIQLHPHFLFNTLNAISTLVYMDPRGADEMIAGLSELLRLSLDNATEQEIPLEQELHFLSLYLNIEQTRFGDRMSVEQNISPDTLNALVPALMLQPLVENAIRHGIQPKRAPGVIDINIQRVGEVLRISIRDTGIGLPTDDFGNDVVQRGIGLANTYARLQSLYPNHYRFRLLNDPSGGCVVELEIPFHTESPSSPTYSKS